MEEIELQEVQIKSVKDIICNKCNKTCLSHKSTTHKEDNLIEYSGLTDVKVSGSYLGYFPQDGDIIKFSLCQYCLRELVLSFEINPYQSSYLFQGKADDDLLFDKEMQIKYLIDDLKDSNLGNINYHKVFMTANSGDKLKFIPFDRLESHHLIFLEAFIGDNYQWLSNFPEEELKHHLFNLRLEKRFGNRPQKVILEIEKKL